MLINLRNALMSGKRTPTAKDYVQSGLIAMWDGIENAGWGVHDASATVWKDLIGDRHLTLSGDAYFGDMFLRTSGNSRSYASGGELLPAGLVVTVEVVVKLFDTSGNPNRFIFGFQPQTSARTAVLVSRILSTSEPRIVCSGGGGQANVSTSAQITEAQTSSFILPNIAAYQNGESSNAKAWGGDEGTNFQSIIIGGTTWNYNTPIAGYNFRLYSRALNAEEIAANYRVDKARFGLP